MKRTLVSVMVLLVTVTLMQSQIWRTQRLEFTAGLGTTQFFGDIGGFTPKENILGLKDISFNHTRFNISIGANYRAIQDANVRLNLAYGLFNSNDKRGSNVAREFVSSTSFFEAVAIGEYYFIRNNAENSFLFSRMRNVRNRPRTLTSPIYRNSIMAKLDGYIFTGFGVVGYSVKANEELTIRGFHKGGFAPVIPVGLGAKYSYSPEISFGVELGGRYVFSDLLEGYTSQYSKYNDVYYFLNATFTYKFDTTDFFR
jgi:hypothetical protein